MRSFGSSPLHSGLKMLSGSPLSSLFLKQICSATPLKLEIRVVSAFTPLYDPTAHILPNISGRTTFRTIFFFNKWL